MISIDTMAEWIGELSDEIPEVLFKELNGGISVSEETKISPYARNGDLYILAEYHKGRYLGRYIQFFYGSIMRNYGRLSDEELKKKLRSVLRHELRHHVESLAGENGLEIEDAKFIRKYLQTK